ncbi:MAG: hypothetical protein KF749_08630 [Bacteroidetes bacterium]|nr:hypothetical protein [Bacteroidota bacterium]MCW5895929.1 hypothetical protein [Bacteroidota bacterium]
MTVLLVLLTLIAFLAADYIVQRRKQKALSTAALRSTPLFPASHWNLSDDLVLAPNHLWMRRERDNSITVGIDNFLFGLTGKVERIELPREGQIVGRGERPIVLREKNKSLALDMPFEGQISAINHSALQSPSMASQNPYTTGWLFKLIPADGARSLTSFLSGERAIEWLKKQNDLVKEFLVARVPQLEFAAMQDGGVPAAGVLKEFDERVWEEFESTFLTTESETPLNGEYDNA